MPPGVEDGLSASPVPRSSVVPTSAPGLRGPHGLSPRQNYSRVNSGAPDVLDAGGLSQKAIMPKVGSVMSISMATRPRALNDMLKTAMESALSRAKIAEEAKRQLENIGEDDRSETLESSASEKSASADVIPTDYVLKLAAATDYIVELLKESNVGVGEGPGALEVTETTPSGPGYVIHTNSGQAGVNKPEMNPGLQKAHPQEHEATQLANDKDRAPGAGDKPVSGSTKNASAPVELLRKMAEGEDSDSKESDKSKKHPPVAQRVGNWAGRNVPTITTITGGLGGATAGRASGGVKGALLGAALGAGIGRVGGQFSQGMAQGMTGGATPYPSSKGGLVPQKDKHASAPIRLLRKLAEDAINPAHISAGTSGQTLETTVTGQPGPAAAGKDRVPATAQGVADMTRREAKSVPKQEMGSLLDEPMMSSSHDSVLQQAFSHTNEAGAKVSSAQQVKVAAARALLRNLAGN